MSGEKMTFESAVAITHLTRMMRVMRDLEWKPGDSTRAYAKEHGISADHAARYSAEAWKRVCAEVNNPDRVGATIGTALEAVVLEALDDSRRQIFVERGVTKDGTPITHQLSPNESRSVVVSAAATWAKIAGVNAADKLELTGKDGGPVRFDPTSMTDEQLLAIVARAGGGSVGGVGTASPQASAGESPRLHPADQSALDETDSPHGPR